MLQTITHPTDPFEAELNASLKEIENLIVASAQADGENNQPFATSDTLNHYFNPFLHKYHDLAAKNRARYTPQTAQHIVVGNNQQYQVKLRELQNKKSECKTREISINAKLDATPEPPKYKKARWAKLAILSLAFLDMGLNVQLFQSWGFSLIQSWLFAPFMAVLFALTAHMTPKAFHKIKKPRVKRIAGILYAICIILLLHRLGIERADYLTRETGYYHSPLPFTILSALFLGVAIALSYFYLPYTEGEKEAIRLYENCLRDKKRVGAEIKLIEGEIRGLGVQKMTVETTGAYTLETAYINHKRIEASARHGLAIYIQVNKRYRNDGLCPDCFDKPFDFNFPDFNLKPEGHE